MSNEVRVAGVGMIPFTKPGASETYDVMGEKAAKAAFEDAGLAYAAVQQAYVGYVYGDSTAGQARSTASASSGIPIVNVNNNCSTGSSALFLARQAVESGAVDCALALGFEQMRAGRARRDLQRPAEPADAALRARWSSAAGFRPEAPVAAQFFGGAGSRIRRASTARSARPSPRSPRRPARHAAAQSLRHLQGPAHASRRCWPRRRSTAR